MYKHARAVRGVSFVYGRETRKNEPEAPRKSKPPKRKKVKPKSKKAVDRQHLKKVALPKLGKSDNPISTMLPTVPAPPATVKVSPKGEHTTRKPLSRQQKVIEAWKKRVSTGEVEVITQKGRRSYKFIVEIKPRER